MNVFDRAPLSGALLGSFVLALLATGCSNETPDREGSTEQEAARGYVTGIRSDPVSSSDGRYVLVDLCHGHFIDGGGGIARVDLADGSQELVTTYPATASVARLGQSGDKFFFALARGSSWDVSVQDWALTAPVRKYAPALPSGVVAKAPWVASLNDDYIVFIDAAHRGSVFVGSMHADVLTTFGVPTDAMLRAAPDGRHVLVATGMNGLVGSVPAVQTLDLTNGPVLSALAPLSLSNIRVVDDSYDGESVLVTALGPAGAAVLTRVDATNGQVQSLAAGVNLMNIVAVRGADIWFATRTRPNGAPQASDTLYQVRRDGSAPPRILAQKSFDANTAPVMLRAYLSRNGRSLLFTVPAASSFAPGSRDAYVVASDGASAPTLLKSNVTYDVLQSGGGRHLVRIKDLASQAVSAELVDDATGARLETLQNDPKGFLVLSGDGSAAFETVSCTLGSVEGQQVNRVSGTPEVLLPCHPTYYQGRLWRMPNTSSVLFVKHLHVTTTPENDLDTGPREMTILAP